LTAAAAYAGGGDCSAGGSAPPPPPPAPLLLERLGGEGGGLQVTQVRSLLLFLFWEAEKADGGSMVLQTMQRQGAKMPLRRGEALDGAGVMRT